MSSRPEDRRCSETEQVALYALDALVPEASSAMQAHLATCSECRRELEELRPLIAEFAYWPTEVVRPASQLWSRVAERLASETGEPVPSAPGRWAEPEWKEVAPGIWCKLLATDSEQARVSMLVRLAPGVHYPPHRHAGVEELHLLDGELWIGERKLRPGDYNLGEAGAIDTSVWSETGCTCVLVTSTADAIL